MLLSKVLYITCIIDKDILYKLYSEDYTQDISKTQYQKKIYKLNWFLINYSMQEEYKFEVDQSKKKIKIKFTYLILNLLLELIWSHGRKLYVLFELGLDDAL